MSTFYGSDTSCVTDVGLIDQQVSSPALVIGQRIARLWQSPRGALGLIDPAAADRGVDVKQYVLQKMAPADIAVAQQQLANEALKDEEVSAITVTITVSNGTLTITAQIVASTGPFTLVGNINQFIGASFFVQ